MNRHAVALMAMGLASACSSAHGDVAIENTLDACIGLQSAKLAKIESALFLPTTWTVRKSTGECGCKSALISYRVTAGPRSEVIATGVLSSLHKQSYAFLINPDASIAYGQQYSLFICCAG